MLSLVHDHKLPLKIYCVLTEVLTEVACSLFLLRRILVTLDVSVDPPHKQIRAQVTHSSCTIKTIKSMFKHQKITSFLICLARLYVDVSVAYQPDVLSLISAAKITNITVVNDYKSIRHASIEPMPKTVETY